MSDSAHAPAATQAAEGHAAGGHSSHPDSFYVKIWGVLLVLLIVSVVGPELGIRVVTLFTAFGIAVVKAYLVIKDFMHLGVEKKYVGYLLVTMLALMVLMVGGIGPDVLRHEGTRWTNVAAQKTVTEGMKAGGGHGEHGSPAPADAHGAPAAHPPEAH
ncbi:MAG: cytochrome C oxidase subunit IV family protein [Myxococcales bacterium]|nr:cytochrome C oxidase subunit IV family protein [Myxococcales bacterium]